MKGTKLFNSFMILTIFVTLSLPQQSLAVDFFGSQDKERISYYKGYNAGIARTLELNATQELSTTGVLEKDVSDLQKQINSLEGQINSISVDDWGIDTLPGSYVNNPMSADLDVNDFKIFNSGNSEPVIFNGPVEIDHDDDTGLNVHAYGNAVRGWSTSETGGAGLFGSGHTGVLGVANYPGGIGVYGQAFGGELAGKFDGDVRVSGAVTASRLRASADMMENDITAIYGVGENGAFAGTFHGPVQVDGQFMVAKDMNDSGAYLFNLDRVDGGNAAKITGRVDIDGDLSVGPALPGKFTVLDENPGGTAFSAAANGNDSKAGFFQANGANSYAVYGIADDASSYAGFFDGGVVISGNFTARPDGEKALKVSTYSNSSTVGWFNSFGDGTKAIHAMTDGNETTAGYFDAAGPNGTAVYGIAHGSGGGAAFFETYNGDSYAVYAKTSGVNSNAINAKAEGEGSYAGYFDGNLMVDNGGELLIGQGNQSKIAPISGGWGGLMISSFLDVAVAIDANNDDPVSAFRVVADSDAPGAPSKPLLTAHSSGKVGIGVEYPERTLDIYSETENAEINLQSGDNEHWGIYQDSRSGNLNFWHGANSVTFTEQGINTGQLCLDKECINDWSDLKRILSEIDPDDTTDYRPFQQ